MCLWLFGYLLQDLLSLVLQYLSCVERLVIACSVSKEFRKAALSSSAWSANSTSLDPLRQTRNRRPAWTARELTKLFRLSPLPRQGLTALNVISEYSAEICSVLSQCNKLRELHLGSTFLSSSEIAPLSTSSILPSLATLTFGSSTFNAQFCVPLLPQLRVLRIEQLDNESFLIQLSKACKLEELELCTSETHWPVLRDQLVAMPALQRVSLRIACEDGQDDNLLHGAETVKALKALAFPKSFDIPVPLSVRKMSWLEELSGVSCEDDLSTVKHICSSFPHMKTLGITLSSAIAEIALSMLTQHLQLIKLAIQVSPSETATPFLNVFQMQKVVPTLESLSIVEDRISVVPFFGVPISESHLFSSLSRSPHRF